MILATNCNSRHPIPIRFGSEKKSQKGVLWNKQTQFFVFLTSKSFVLLWLFMGRKMRKKYFQKHGKNIIFCVSSKSSLFEVAILNLGLEGSNLRILRLGRAHMPRNIQNYWFLTKNNHVKKSVPKICNSPRALALNVQMENSFRS